jgi:hypothetical protein
MEFIHMANVRLGYRPDAGCPWSDKRKEDIYTSFEDTLKRAEKNQTDYIFITGNLFDGIPDIKQLDYVNSAFSKLTHSVVIYLTGDRDFQNAKNPIKNYNFVPWVFVMGRDTNPGTEKKMRRGGLRSSRATVAVDCIFFEEDNLYVYGVSCFDKRIRNSVIEEIEFRQDSGVNFFLAGSEINIDSLLKNPTFSRENLCYAGIGGRYKYQVMEQERIYTPGSLESINVESKGPHGYIKGSLKSGQVSGKFAAVSKADYKTITLPVGNYTKDADINTELLRMLELEGGDNIYTIKLARTAGCEKNFELDKRVYDYRILNVEGERFNRLEYDSYEKDNRNTRFGKLLEQLGNADMGSSDSVKYAVDMIIDISQVYKRHSKRISDSLFEQTKKQAVLLIRAKCEACENSSDMKAYNEAMHKYSVSEDVLEELNAVWARERGVELEMRTLRTRLEEIPRAYRRSWVMTGVRTALIPFIVGGILSIFLFPTLYRTGITHKGVYLFVSLMLLVVAGLLFYGIGYEISKNLSRRSSYGGGKRTMTDGIEELESELSVKEKEKEKLHERRTKLQLQDKYRRELEGEISQKETQLLETRHELELLKEALKILSI